MYKRQLRVLYIILTDILLINMAFILSFYLRFDANIPDVYFQAYTTNVLILTIIKVGVFAFFKLYNSLWRYASIEEVIQIAIATVVANIVSLTYLLISGHNFPRSVYLIIVLLDLAFIGGNRLSYRIVRRIKNNNFKLHSEEKRVLIIGAGDAGAMVIKELNNHNQLKSKPVAIIDDDIRKEGTRINGVPVVGQRYDIRGTVIKRKIDEVIIAIPSASKGEIKEIVDECKRTKCKTKILPGMFEIINGRVDIKQIRDVQIEDLLGREEVRLNTEGISDYIEGKRVIVTGGGGSIGSELCRQIARFNPKELAILDIYENNAYDLQNELRKKYKNLNLKTIIASVRDKRRLEEIFGSFKPDVVFHAAAHKHVPLMEDNPSEAIKNNVFGTLNVAQCADKYNARKFVLISTDKAVNPTNIMGASKRMCEMIVQSMEKVSKTEFVAVRFGNVLGSNGSVIPLFKKQIAEGGPVTVTHKDIIRYFMTIPEASQLVIQAGSMARGGEIFVLDMGEPVKIIDLAKDLIKLSGFEPDQDINIEITGLRPGEKLFEELLMDEEGMKSTGHKKIFIGKPIFTDYKILLKQIEKLKKAILDEEDIREVMMDVVPTYKKPEEINSKVIINDEIAVTKG